MSIEIIPTGAALGAEIRGVDLARSIDDETFAAIERAYYDHAVIFFRDQHITPPQQVAFTRRFGEIEFNIFGERWSVPGSPEIVVVSNVTEDGRPIGVRRAGENWHSDMCYASRPPRGTMLYALEIPELFGLALGDTEFASTAAAWDALPERMRQHLDGRRAVFDFAGRKRAFPPTQAEIDRYPPVTHPIVRTHSVTRRKCVYVMRDDCTGSREWREGKPRRPEIDENSIAHVLGDEAVGAHDDIGHGAMVSGDDVAQILGIEPRRQFGRADKVAEHHRQLPAFGVDLCRCIRGGPRHHGGRNRHAEAGNRVEQLAPVADRGHPDADQVFGGELPQHLGVDIIVAEGRHIALKAQILQPRRYVHAVILGSEKRHPGRR
jgi:taurine dioxygenase